MLTDRARTQAELGAEQHEPNQWHEDKAEVDRYSVGKQGLPDDWDLTQERNRKHVEGARVVDVLTVVGQPLRVEEVGNANHQ